MSRIRTLGAALAVSALVFSCAPINTIGDSLSSSTTGGTSGTTTTTTSTTSTTLNTCSLMDLTNPDRNICQSCYNTILSQSCPSIAPITCATYATDPAQCCPSTTVSQFPTLLNQCITQSQARGVTCALTCASGLVLSPTSCACVSPSSLPAPSMPAGGSTYVNVGQTNFGPPIVNIDFSGSQAYPAGNGNSNSCTAKLSPIPMYVTNRSQTTPNLNVNTIQSVSCVMPDGTPAPLSSTGQSIVTAVQAPKSAASTSTSFTVSTSGSMDQFAIYNQDFDSDSSPEWKILDEATLSLAQSSWKEIANPSSLKKIVLGTNALATTSRVQSQNRVLGPLASFGGGSAGNEAWLHLNRMKSGSYRLSFVLYPPVGATPGAVFNVRQFTSATAAPIRTNATVVAAISSDGAFPATWTATTGAAFDSQGANISVLQMPTIGGAWMSFPYLTLPATSGSSFSFQQPLIIKIDNIVVPGTTTGDLDLLFRLDPTAGRNAYLDSVELEPMPGTSSLIYSEDFEGAGVANPAYGMGGPTRFNGTNSGTANQHEWLTNGVPLISIPQIGTAIGPFGDRWDTPNPSTAFFQSNCTALRLPDLKPGDYQVDFTFLALDSWDASAVGAGRDEFAVFYNTPGVDTNATIFFNIFGNYPAGNWQYYGGPDTCRIAIGFGSSTGNTDVNWKYCENCARTCAGDPTKFANPAVGFHQAGAYRTDNFFTYFETARPANSARPATTARPAYNDSAYQLSIPFTKPTSEASFPHGDLIFCKIGVTAENIEDESFALANVQVLPRGAATSSAIYQSSFSSGRAPWWRQVYFNYNTNNTGTTATTQWTDDFWFADNLFWEPSKSQLTPNRTSVVINEPKNASLIQLLGTATRYFTPNRKAAPPAEFQTGEISNTFDRYTTQFLGPFNQTNRIRYPGLYLRDLEPGDYLVEFDLLAFDGIAAYPNPGRINIRVNGNLITSFYQENRDIGSGGSWFGGPLFFAQPFYESTDYGSGGTRANSYPTYPSGGGGGATSSQLQTCFGMICWKDSAGYTTSDPDRVFKTRFTFKQQPSAQTNPYPPVYIEFSDSGLDTIDNESWGIDNFKIIKKNTDLDRPICGIRYRFTDPSANSADYCLRFKPSYQCAQGGTQNCTCGAQAVDEQIQSFSAVSPLNPACP